MLARSIKDSAAHAWSRMGLRLKLEVFIIVAFFPLIALVVTLLVQQRNTDIEHARQQVLLLAERGAAQQGDVLKQMRGMMEMLTLIPQVRQPDDPEPCEATLRQFMDYQPWSVGFAVAAPDGRLLCRTVRSNDGMTVADQEYFQRALATKSFSTSNFRIGRYSGKALLAAALPVLNDDGTIRSVLLTGLDLKWLAGLSKEATAVPGSRLTMFDAEGTVLVRVPDGGELQVGQRMSDHPLGRALFQTDHGVFEGEGFTGEARIIGFAALQDTGGRITVGMSRNLVLGPANHKMLWSVVVLAAVVVTIIVGVWFLLDILVLRGLRSLQRSATALSVGRDDPAPVRPGGFQSREIGTAAQAVHDMGVTLQAIAYTDPLTGLGNRRFLENHVEQLSSTRPRDGMAVAALCIDLDGFKPVNDRHGHHIGDAVLSQVGTRLANCVRDQDKAARVGGDEFVVLLTLPASDHPRPDEVAARIIQALSVPMTLDGVEVQIGCSIGIALWPADDIDLNTVLRYADQALYAAKRGGRGQAKRHQGQQPASPATPAGIPGDPLTNPV